MFDRFLENINKKYKIKETESEKVTEVINFVGSVLHKKRQLVVLSYQNRESEDFVVGYDIPDAMKKIKYKKRRRVSH